MSQAKGKKRSKASYRRNTYGNKRQKTEGNYLMPGVQGFLVTCNNHEVFAVRESYNILNEYADAIYGQGKSGVPAIDDKQTNKPTAEAENTSHQSDDEDDLEAALKKEVAEMTSVPSELKRFQNCKTKANNCVFIRSTVADPVKVALSVMEDIASRQISRARHALRLLPVVGTCKPNMHDIIELAKTVFRPVFASDANPPSSYTIVFKARNNNNISSCGKTSVIPALVDVIKDINPDVAFSWSEFELAVLVEIVCTVCCLVVAPNYARLKKYNLVELAQGSKCDTSEGKAADDTSEKVDISANSKSAEKIVNNTVQENIESSQSLDTPAIKDNGVEKENQEDRDNNVAEVKVADNTSEKKDVSVNSEEKNTDQEECLDTSEIENKEVDKESHSSKIEDGIKSTEDGENVDVDNAESTMKKT